MRITATGHAGVFVDTAAGGVLCDPWRSPAYFASWFPFPDNGDVDFAAFKPDFLYISHLHRDHFDRELLARSVPRSTTVILPDFPTDELHQALRDLGFYSFVHTSNGEPVDLDGLRVMITAMVSPTDGPIGDSALSLDDGEQRVLNQNDARPPDPEQLVAFGPYDGHFLQFSGAIWWPVVYDLPEANRLEFAKRKRINGMARARRFIDAVGARYVFPTAGPPCFLDADLFEYNDFSNSPDNIFPDQTVFLDYLADQQITNGRLLIPGSVAELTPAGCKVTHPLSDDAVQSIFNYKRSYLEAYAERQRPRLEREKASWPSYDGDLLAALKDWWEPLLDLADQICEGVGAPVLLDLGREQIVVDFTTRQGAQLGGRGVPVPVHPGAPPRRSPGGGARGRLGQQPVSLDEVPCATARPVQRVRLHLLQVLVGRAHLVCRGLVRRTGEHRRPGHDRRLHGPASLPAPQGGLVPLRRRDRRGARMRHARMAFRPGERPMPDRRGPRHRCRAGRGGCNRAEVTVMSAVSASDWSAQVAPVFSATRSSRNFLFGAAGIPDTG